MSQRRPVRIDQDGPWTVSVADSPHDARAYSLYIKTSTHNLTLTRNAFEIIELDSKLRENPDTKLPKLPLDPSLIPPKRKSTFLNTLSRLASPNAGRGSRKASAPSPSNELNDPFTDITEDDAASMVIPSPTATSSGIAAYLTTIANTPSLRTSRPFKRFIRVRTDDLESVRVERAIKRVRSDLAAHTGRSSKDKENHPTPPVPPLPEKQHTVSEAPSKEEKLEEVSNEPEELSSEQKEVVAPPSPVNPPTRLHRSKSVDADSSDRMSRSFASSSSQQDNVDGGMSSSASIDGEDSSASTQDLKKKKKKKEKVPRPSNRKVVITDFEMMRVLGKGCAGKVLLVKHKNSSDLYALKAITKRHVLAHQELQHTLTEQAVLKRMAAANRDPFVVKLWWSFHDKENLFLVMDFHPGGDLATQLARWGRLGRDRARFYAAEIVEGVEGLHNAGVIYRDLKPENILIGGDGHIVLTDFGLSKEFPKRIDNVTQPSTPGGKTDFYSDAGGPNGLPTIPPWMKQDKSGETLVGWGVVSSKDSTTTFCGTAEYLAPEVIQGQSYSYEVDWWSFGTMLYEMLTGITPFWANNHSDMYVRVLQDELTFPDDRALDQDTKSLIRGLLQRTPSLRMCEPRIKKHPYFSMIDWSHVYYKRYIPPYIPPVDPSNAGDTQNFDETFLGMEPVLDDADDEETDHTTDGSRTEDDTDGAEEGRTPSQSRRNSEGEKKKESPVEDDSVDVFDGYSFKGRHSVLIDDDDDSGSGSEGSSDGFSMETGEKDDVVMQHLKEATDKLEEQLGVEREEAQAVDEEEEEEEPKTPPAKPPTALPPAVDVVEEPREELEPSKVSESRKSKDLPRPTSLDQSPPPAVPTKDAARDTRHTKPPNLIPPRPTKRKEKSGVAALDQYLSPDDGERTEMDDDEDDDWDLIDASNIEGEEKNGGRGTTLFARGVVDKYKLTIAGFGRNRVSTPGRASRSASGATIGTNGSPTPSSPSTPGGTTKKRGRNQGYSFKKTRQFLRARSPPPSSFSNSTTLPRKTSSSTPTSTPSLGTSGSLNGFSTLHDTSMPSLKTKGSSLSANSSGGVGGGVFSDGELSASPENERSKGSGSGKKLKKVKDKMFSSIFSSPRPQAASFAGKEKE